MIVIFFKIFMSNDFDLTETHLTVMLSWAYSLQPLSCNQIQQQPFYNQSYMSSKDALFDHSKQNCNFVQLILYTVPVSASRIILRFPLIVVYRQLLSVKLS